MQTKKYHIGFEPEIHHEIVLGKRIQDENGKYTPVAFLHEYNMNEVVLAKRYNKQKINWNGKVQYDCSNIENWTKEQDNKFVKEMMSHFKSF